VQILALLLFLYLFAAATFMNPMPGLADLFYRLDPLVALTAMLAGRAFISGLGLAAVTLLLTVVFGRVWCGWLCPMGTTLDLVAPGRRARRALPRPPGERWRAIKYVLLIFLLAAAVFGSQSFLFLDPITLMTRTLANAVWPALRSAIYAVEAFLYQFEFLWGGLDAVHQAMVYPLFRDEGGVYILAVPVLLFFAGILSLNWIAERFWCRYLCPLGGLLGLFSRVALFRRVVGEQCTGCAACSRRCPTGTINPGQGFASAPAECTVCYDCIEACPRDGVAFHWHLPFAKIHPAGSPGASPRAAIPGRLASTGEEGGDARPITEPDPSPRQAIHGNFLPWKPAPSQPYDPGRREALGAIGAAMLWSALSGVEPIQKRQPADLIRPPGASQTAFEELCIRCNECVKICATQGLQPSFLEAGWQNALTPRLVPRLGYCSYNCNACGQVCPSGAIPNLTLEAKRLVPIGLARVDRNRCLPWAYGIDCIVCEEACPLGKKAIELEVAEIVNGSGETVTVQRPYVIKERCIGCGVCEYQCPMGGEAAIRVFAYTEVGGFLGDDPNFGKQEN
jgi:polyferredoxin